MIKSLAICVLAGAVLTACATDPQQDSAAQEVADALPLKTGLTCPLYGGGTNTTFWTNGTVEPLWVNNQWVNYYVNGQGQIACCNQATGGITWVAGTKDCKNVPTIAGGQG